MGLDKELAAFGIPAEGELYGFAQAVKVGDTIFVSGQTASGDPADEASDMEAQMRAAYAKVARALAQFGVTLDHVVDETLFVADYLAAARVAGRVRHDVYGGTPQVASTLIPVASFGVGTTLVEIKCVARV
jgi:enamine deaminase RidA (YjgF/YER057c/UK114 family)